MGIRWFSWVMITTVVAAQSVGIRFVNLSETATAVDFYINDIPTPIIQNVLPHQATGVRTEFPASTYKLQVRKAGDTAGAILAQLEVQLQAGWWYSICFVDYAGKPELLLLPWDQQKPQLTNVRLRFLTIGSEQQLPLTVTLRGNPFILNLPYRELSEFLEVPLLQVERVGILDALNDAQLLAEFAGAFEGNNVYTVCFVQRNRDWYAIVLNESQQDEQTGLTELRKLTFRFQSRLVNLGTDFAVALYQAGREEVLLQAGNRSASGTEELLVRADSVLSIYRAGTTTNPLAQFRGFTALPATNYWFVAAPVGLQWYLLPVPLEDSPWIPEQILLRVVNLYADAPAVDVAVVIQGDTLAVDSLPVVDFSHWFSFPWQDFRLIVRNAQTAELLFDAIIPGMEFLGMHLLYLVADQQGEFQIYYAQEEFSSKPTPLKRLQFSTKIDAAFRLAHVATIEDPLIVEINGAPFGQTLSSEQATAVLSPVPSAQLQVSVKREGQDSILQTTVINVTPQRRYLTVLWGQDSLRMLTVESPYKVGDGTQLWVRFIHCNDSLPTTVEIDMGLDKPVQVEYQQASAFIALQSGTTTLDFEIAEPKGRRWYCQVDLLPAHLIYTIVLTAGPMQPLAGWMLAEEIEQAQVLTAIQVDVLSGRSDASHQFHPISILRYGEEYRITVDLPRWQIVVMDGIGRIVQQRSGAGPQTLRLSPTLWARGWYWVIVRASEGQRWVVPLHIW